MVIQYQRGRLRDDAQRLAALTAEPAFVFGQEPRAAGVPGAR